MTIAISYNIIFRSSNPDLFLKMGPGKGLQLPPPPRVPPPDDLIDLSEIKIGHSLKLCYLCSLESDTKLHLLATFFNNFIHYLKSSSF